MPSKRSPPPPDRVAQARLLYDAGVAPVADVAKLLGMSESRFRAFRQANGWPLRASPIRARGNDAAAESGKPPRALSPSRSLIARLEDAVEREFAHAEEALAKRTPKAIETSARTLASLVRTLAELKRMSRDADSSHEGAREDDDGATDESRFDQPPRQLAELRAELARRLERLRGERPSG